VKQTKKNLKCCHKKRYLLDPHTSRFYNESFFRKKGLVLELDSEESLTQRPKASRLFERNFSALDPTLLLSFLPSFPSLHPVSLLAQPGGLPVTQTPLTQKVGPVHPVRPLRFSD
jgi:hypothetical protein